MGTVVSLKCILSFGKSVVVTVLVMAAITNLSSTMSSIRLVGPLNPWKVGTREFNASFHEKQPDVSIQKRIRKPPSPSPCTARGYLSVSDGGRLGNLMSQYATLFAHAKRLNVKAVITKTMGKSLRKVFPHLTIPIERSTMREDCDWNWSIVDYRNLSKADFGPDGLKNVFISGFPADLPTFNQYHKELSVQGEFKFSMDLRRSAKIYLEKVAAQKRQKPDIFVGVHVRRTDYSIYLKNKVNGRMLTKLYFANAMDYFVKKFIDKKVVFVFSSDDTPWCKKMFGKREDVVFTQQTHLMNRAEFDLAILAHCKHSILSYGTYSFWAAYVRNQGEVIIASGYSDHQPQLLMDIKTTLPSWKQFADPCYIFISQTAISIRQDCWEKRIEVGLLD